ncbi:glutamate racemase [Salmonella enterica subsp. enterica]|nr:glutamate racemase [Salmonella enterica subsp. enterica]
MMRFGGSCRISTIYMAFDNVAFPYGEKSETFIVERVVEIVTAGTAALSPFTGGDCLQYRQYGLTSRIT